MMSPIRMTIKNRLALLFVISFSIGSSFATTLDTIGVTLLRSSDSTLIGTGVNVAQSEAPENFDGTAWQVNPFAIGQPTNLITYISIDGSASNYPNALGIESSHADSVAGNFYGTAVGVAPGVAHVDNYEANNFYLPIITVGIPIQAKIVNQSFIFGVSPPQTNVDSEYDNFAALNNTLFVSGAGNGGPPSAPATAYNGIGVAAFGGASSIGPTLDNGRSKPDITAPAGATSFSTPLVAGAAAILVQAGLRGDGGAGTINAASDIRTLKALLFNGAVKPTNWAHTTTTPLDTRFGAGILNVYNSYKQLAAGKFSFVESTAVAVDDPHPPESSTSNVASLIGWDFNSISSSVPNDRVNHYYFDLPVGLPFTLTTTLVWNRQFGETDINNLNLYLYKIGNTNPISLSVSTVDNVEHIFSTGLSSGRYDIQVLKKGGLTNVSSPESYALAFQFFTQPLEITRSGNQAVLTWPLSPDGFSLQATPDLTPPIVWAAVTNTVVVTNNQNRVTIPPASASQFFRLSSP